MKKPIGLVLTWVQQMLVKVAHGGRSFSLKLPQTDCHVNFENLIFELGDMIIEPLSRIRKMIRWEILTARGCSNIEEDV